MYINDVHILWYIVILVAGAVIGQLLDWVNQRILDNKKIFSKEILNYLKKKPKINYITVFITAILYLIVLYEVGIKKDMLDNLNLIKYLVLIPMLVSIIMIDYKKKIIPNRITLKIFETGIIFTFLYALNNLFVARNYLIAMILGALIFGSIALVGRSLAGKEAMGMGDVKLMTALGLYFGISLTISISVISFIIAAVFSVIAVIKKKKKSEYMPFGPCIGVSAILCIVIPEKVIVSVLLVIFTLGRYKI